MPRVIYRPAAEDDLAELYRYIVERSGSPEIAIGYIRRIRVQCRKLLTFPHSGRPRDDLRPGLRVVGFERRAVIAYKVTPSGDIEVGRVFYGGRHYEAIIGELE